MKEIDYTILYYSNATVNKETGFSINKVYGKLSLDFISKYGFEFQNPRGINVRIDSLLFRVKKIEIDSEIFISFSKIIYAGTDEIGRIVYNGICILIQDIGNKYNFREILNVLMNPNSYTDYHTLYLNEKKSIAELIEKEDKVFINQTQINSSTFFSYSVCFFKIYNEFWHTESIEIIDEATERIDYKCFTIEDLKLKLKGRKIGLPKQTKNTLSEEKKNLENQKEKQISHPEKISKSEPEKKLNTPYDEHEILGTSELAKLTINQVNTEPEKTENSNHEKVNNNPESESKVVKDFKNGKKSVSTKQLINIISLWFSEGVQDMNDFFLNKISKLNSPLIFILLLISILLNIYFLLTL